MAQTVSVIIPFYGTDNLQRLKLVTESILAQKEINVDLVVAGLNQATRISNSCDIKNIPIEKITGIVKVGQVINRGLKLARGEFTYISDADILFHNEDYLGKLVHESLSHGNSLKRPPMRRLLLQDFEYTLPNNPSYKLLP